MPEVLRISGILFSNSCNCANIKLWLVRTRGRFLLNLERSGMTQKPFSAKAPFIWHGGDYNPEQWPAEIWQDDFRLMQEAGITVATIGVFSWVSLQPSENEFTFEWLYHNFSFFHFRLLPQ